MQTRTTGPLTVSAIGLGGMPMSIEGRPDEARSVRTIHAALDAGVTLIDTAARGLRRDRRGARGLAAAGDARLDAGQGAGGHPDPRCKPP